MKRPCAKSGPIEVKAQRLQVQRRSGTVAHRGSTDSARSVRRAIDQRWVSVEPS
jgi:hypothetical protein